MAAHLKWAVALLFVAAPAGLCRAQPAEASPLVPPARCDSCHACRLPAPGNLCLRECTRSSPPEPTEDAVPIPDVVILNELEDLYLPVPFDHKGHAQMAEMTRGCVVCHHFTPENTPHPACKTCHAISPQRENILMPGLKGAYHRQCMNCHREWSHETSCSICHPPKTGVDDAHLLHQPTVDDIVGRMHPPIPEPDVEVYSTTSDEAPGFEVIFRHRDHIHRYGLRCVDCHHEDGCMRCHEAGRTHIQMKRPPGEQHKSCSACHDVGETRSCTRCHRQHGSPSPAPFDHASVGRPLSRHHARLSCRQCHRIVPFESLDPTCDSCHGDWAPTTFRHEVTGLQLNAAHREFDCESCHLGRAFDRPPTCDECHDDDEDITYPTKRPGSLTSERR